MAASIKPLSGGQFMSPEKPQLLCRLDGHTDTVNQVVLIGDADDLAVISVSDDRTIRVWARRDTGQYWPSVCHTMPSLASAMDYDPQLRRLFVAMDNGSITEFELADDLNKITYRRSYIAHQQRVTSMKFSPVTEWLISAGKDKYFQWHCTETGRRLGAFLGSAWCTTVALDQASRHAFVGDYSGEITMLKLTETSYQPVTTLKGHSGSVQSLLWDERRRLLISGGFDQIIIVWDIGGGKGTAYELSGHRARITGLALYSASSLLSVSEDSTLVVWDVAAQRQETPEWTTRDCCERCARPFFWNVRGMFDQKQVGSRQHHCRRCGRALCDACSENRSTLPRLGFEFPVRICNECHLHISDGDREPLAKFHDLKAPVTAMSLSAESKTMVTIGTDRSIKIWDLSKVL
ncbi:WD repeat and FYVE domain-containing protein 2-like isoform X1 [Varroa jacobsoni]|uniref:FYVE-type domain-containing protein n=2 Tax=Varroa destructor TaxID=109461 RepID=A0A7M7KLC0_VARDE|nr:WD repeat and FYVE domain-containing protein 2-like isoform X1 [Varroa destructor]XP_022668619.1 WD repeat and FYVE domain-containing protein 2-like isoform X1 [Varroa destructor]XP_022668620.1 WD repeat and FYVE domain-containing protein 2-like isoform X1 [Varroa destructor]XP_022710335.1 WD repeat and FYVE domain-containing protein 2-like isoform X1 [Varroa jacobsoni]XP_022710336.1 WD repeat and FYVE domain-containing protein 2-like isoform X1 [Varroa jacobsoni]